MTGVPIGVRLRRLLIVALMGVIVGIGVASIIHAVTTPHRTTPVYDPPVLAGQHLWGACTGGFYARLGDRRLTSTGHCTTEGTWPTPPTARRSAASSARLPASHVPLPGHICAASDINYLVVATDQIPGAT